MSTSGSSMIYLDNAATSFPKAPGLGRAMAAQIENFPGNPGRGTHAAALAADRLLFDARDAVARAIGAPEPARLIFTKGATEALNIVLFGLLDRGPLSAQPSSQGVAQKAGAPLVVTSSYEHNAVMRPLRWLEKHRGVKVFVLPFDEAGLPDEEALEHALSLKPDLAVFTMASNVTGVVLPWEELSWQFHRAGSLVCLDGSQYIGHFPFDMSATCADFLCFPGHKGLLGPTGIGALYLAGGPLPEPLVMGGTGSHSLSEEQPAELPDRFEAGTQNLAGAAGLLHAVNFVASVGLDAICEREAYLTNRLIAGLSAISGIRVYGPELVHSENAHHDTLGQTEWKTDGMTSHRTGDRTDDQTFRPSDKHAPVVSFLPENLPLDIFAAELDKRGVVARHGLHCAPEAHRTIGSVDFGGTVRFSPGYFTTEQEIDEALSIVEQISRHC